MKEENRGMLLVGIKLIGLWLLFHAVVNLTHFAITGAAMHHVFKQVETRAPWQVPSGISQELAREMTEKWKMDDTMQKFTYQMQMTQAWSQIPWQLILALIGLYMCRSGALIRRLLGEENETNPNQQPEGIRN